MYAGISKATLMTIKSSSERQHRERVARAGEVPLIESFVFAELGEGLRFRSIPPLAPSPRVAIELAKLLGESLL